MKVLVACFVCGEEFWLPERNGKVWDKHYCDEHTYTVRNLFNFPLPKKFAIEVVAE